MARGPLCPELPSNGTIPVLRAEIREIWQSAHSSVLFTKIIHPTSTRGVFHPLPSFFASRSTPRRNFIDQRDIKPTEPLPVHKHPPLAALQIHIHPRCNSALQPFSSSRAPPWWSPPPQFHLRPLSTVTTASSASATVVQTLDSAAHFCISCLASET